MAGRLYRDAERKLSGEGYAAHKGVMALPELVLSQKRKTKNKVYSLHASEVECTGKLPAMTFVDKGYKGRGEPEELSHVPIRRTSKLGNAFKRQLRWRAEIEPEIGLMKGDGLPRAQLPER